MIYVLIILSTVYGGRAPAVQEFADKAACEAAAVWVRDNGGGSNTHVACFPKATLPTGSG